MVELLSASGVYEDLGATADVELTLSITNDDDVRWEIEYTNWNGSLLADPDPNFSVSLVPTDGSASFLDFGTLGLPSAVEDYVDAASALGILPSLPSDVDVVGVEADDIPIPNQFSGLDMTDLPTSDAVVFNTNWPVRLPYFDLPSDTSELQAFLDSALPSGVSLNLDDLPTSPEEYASGQLEGLSYPSLRTESANIDAVSNEAEFNFGTLDSSDLLDTSNSVGGVVEPVRVDLTGIESPEPALLRPTGEPTVSPPDGVGGAFSYDGQITFEQEIENVGGAASDEGEIDVAVVADWLDASPSATATVPPIDPGETATVSTTVSAPELDPSTDEAIDIAEGSTQTEVIADYSGPFEQTGEQTIASFDFDQFLPGEPASVFIDNVVPGLLSIPTSGEIPTGGFEVTLENNGDEPAEGVTISGFGDSATVDIPPRGSETVQLTPTPSVLPGVGGEVEQDIVAEFGGTTADSEVATIEQAAPEGPSFDFVELPDVSLEPGEPPGPRDFVITNTGDQPAPVNINVGEVTADVGSVSPGETPSPVAVNLDSVSLPEPGETTEVTAEIVDQTDGTVYKRAQLPITLGVDVPDVSEEPEDVLFTDSLSLPMTVISGDRADLNLSSVDDVSREVGMTVTNLSGVNATAQVNFPNSVEAVGPFASEFSDNTTIEGAQFFRDLSAGDEVTLGVNYGSTGQFSIPPTFSGEGSWTVPPIAGVTAFPQFTLGEPSIPSNLNPNAPFEISAVVGSKWPEPAEAEVGVIINGSEVYTTNKTLWPPGTSGSSKPVTYSLVPELGSGVLSGLAVEDSVTIRIEVRNTPSTPSGQGGVVDSYEATRFIRPPVQPDLSINAPSELQFAPDEPVSFPVTVVNNGEAVGQLDLQVTQDGEDVFDDTIEVPPGETQDVAIEDDLSPDIDTQYTISTNLDSIEDKTVGVSIAPLPKPNIGFSVAEPDLLDVGESLTLPVEVTNSGEEDGEVDVSLTPDGGDAQTQTVTVPAGGSETVEFSPTPPSPDNPLTYTINVAGEERTVTARMEDLEPANFSLETPDSVTMDDPSVVEVEAVVENTGQEAGSTEVSMLDDSEVVELDGGESTTVPLRTDITPSPGDTQDYTVSLSDGTSDTVSVEFPSDLADTALPTAEIDVENTGEASGSMTLLLDGNIVGSRDVDAGETATFTVEPPLPDPGTELLYEVRVRPDDGSDGGDAEQFSMATDVLPEPAPPSFNLVDVVAPDEARVGETITVDAVVENTGGESGEVTVRSDGDIRQVTIDGGSQEIVTLSLPSPFNQGFEDYEVSVGDQTEQVSVDFRDVEPDVPDAPELPETPQPPQQPGLPQPPGQTPGVPSPPGGGEQPYDGIFTYLDPFGVFGTSKQINLFGDD